MDKKKLGILEILASAALWSIAGIFMKKLNWSGFVISGIRSLIAGSVVFIYMRISRIRFHLNRQNLFGAVALCITMTLFSLANKMTTAANAIVLQYTCPVWIMILSAAFLKWRFSGVDVLTVAVTFLGIGMFFYDGLGDGNTVGNCVALASGLTFACYYISLGNCGENDRMSVIIMANLFTFLIGVPFLFTTSPHFGATEVTNILVLGVLQLGVPYLLLAKGAAVCPPLLCSLLGALEPLLNPVWVALFDGEIPGILALVGGVIVIAAVSLWCVYDAKRGNGTE